MKKNLKKILRCMPSFVLEYLEWIFLDSAENQIRITKFKKNKFRSYTQLKKHQKNVKLFFISISASVLLVFIGFVTEPVLFPKEPEAEIYIPSGKGDILLGNISRNQVTVIFKTLDSANGNQPLATKAVVEVFSDENYTNLVRRSIEDEYAITHVIAVDSLQENNVYYVRITVKDASTPTHTKIISSWGNGGDPIKFFTTGEVIANCVPVGKLAFNDKIISVKQADAIVDMDDKKNIDENNQADKEVLQIENVLSENHLQPKNKVQSIISWNTNKLATATIIYREGGSSNKNEVTLDKQVRTKHAIVLTMLKPGTTYYFSLKSIDQQGNNVMSEEYSLRTPNAQLTIVEKISESFKDIFRQIKPN